MGKGQSKAIAYVRVAAPVQKVENLSIQKQKQQILEAAKQLNVEVVKWFIQEGYEPVAFPSSVLNQAVEYCRDEEPDIEYLLVANITRLSRSLHECIYWEVAFNSIGVGLKTADDIEFNSAVGLFIDQMSELMGQYNRERGAKLFDRALRDGKIKEA